MRKAKRPQPGCFEDGASAGGFKGGPANRQRNAPCRLPLALPPPGDYPARMDLLLCLTTCPDATSARRIAAALVEERLAACVNVIPGLHSTYRWQGAVERADELLLLIKTTRAAFPALQARLPALHPYELPELVAVEPANALPAYLQWVEGAVRT